MKIPSVTPDLLEKAASRGECVIQFAISHPVRKGDRHAKPSMAASGPLPKRFEKRFWKFVYDWIKR